SFRLETLRLTLAKIRLLRQLNGPAIQIVGTCGQACFALTELISRSLQLRPLLVQASALLFLCLFLRVQVGAQSIQFFRFPGEFRFQQVESRSLLRRNLLLAAHFFPASLQSSSERCKCGLLLLYRRASLGQRGSFSGYLLFASIQVFGLQLRFL